MTFPFLPLPPEVTVIFIVCLISHGLVPLNDGLYWDGWIIQGIYRQKDLGTMKTLARQGGLIFYYYIHWFMARWPKPVLTFKIFSFLCMFFSPLLVFYICRETGAFSDMESLCICLLAVSYPGNNMTVDPCVIVYILHLPVFFFACWLGLYAQSASGVAQLLLQGATVMLFLVSFNLNSLLVFFLGVFFLLPAGHTAGAGGDLFAGIASVSQGWVYLPLPFMYWYWKETFTPRHGQYETYNKIRFRFQGIKRLPASFSQLLQTGGGGVYLDSLRLLFKSPWAPALLVVVGGGLWGLPDTVIAWPHRSVGQCAGIIFIGFFLLICGSIPYVLVGQNFGKFGWESKNNILMPVPLALILYGGARLLLPVKPAVFCLVVCGVAGIVSLNYNYLRILAVYVKNRSILENLKKIKGVETYRIWGVFDRHRIRFPSLGQPEHRPAYLIYMFERLWGEMTRLGINETKMRHTPYSTEEIQQQIRATTIDFALKEIDIHGPQALLVVDSGENIIKDHHLAVAYLICRLFKKDRLDRLFSSLTRLTVIPLKRQK